MRKWLLAFALCLTLCLCASAALADDHLAIIVSNAEPQNGEVSGAYYYKLYADTNLYSFLIGWSTDPTAEAPDEDDWYPTDLDQWAQEGDDYFIVTTPPTGGDCDALFYRISEDDPWEKLVFHYDLSKTATAEIPGMTEEAPGLFQEDYTLEWDAVAGADAYFFYMIRPDTEGQPVGYITSGNNVTMTAPNYNESEIKLWPVGEYECWVVAMANQQKISPSAHTYYTVSPILPLTEEQKLTVTVNGSAQPEQDALSSSSLRVKLKYGNGRPTAVRIINGDYWEYWWGDDSFERDWGFGDGEILVYAEGTYDDIDFDALDASGWKDFDRNRDVNWTVSSNLIRLNVSSPNGTMHAPDFTIQNPEMAEGGAIPWGDSILVQIADPGPSLLNEDGGSGRVIDDAWFNCNLYVLRADENGNTWWDRINRNYSYDVHSGLNKIPTYNLDGGRYQLEIGADGEGYSGRWSQVEFILGEKPENLEEAVKSFTVNGSTDDLTVQTYEEIQLSAYHSNAEWYNVEIHKEGDNGWWDERGNNRDGMLLDSWRANEEGTYILEANGYRQDGWEELIGTVTVTVQAPEGDMAPVIAALSADEVNMGDELTLTFSGPSNAENFNYWVHSAQNGNWVAGSGRNGIGTATIDTDRLESGVYCVEIDAQATGYNQSHTTLYFVLLDENAAEQNLTVTVNGSTQAEQDALSSTSLYVKVTYGDRRPTAVRILNGNHWEYWWGEDDFQRDWGFGDGEILVYAEGTDDEIDFDALDNSDWEDFDWNRDVHWTRKSNMIHVNVSSPNGTMHAPDFTIQNPELAEGGAIPWGNSILIQIADLGPSLLNADGGAGRVIDDGWFNCNLYVLRADENGNTWWDRINRNYNYDVHSGLNAIPTYNLDGGRYQLEIGADGEGYSGRWSQVEFILGAKPENLEEAIKSFTVNGSAENLTVRTYDEIQLNAYHSGAEWYNVEIHKEGSEGWRDDRSRFQGGMLLDSWRANEEGTYILEAYAYGHIRDENGNIIRDENGQDEWEEFIGTVTVTANASHGTLGAVRAAMADKAYVGEDLTIIFSAPDNAEYFNCWVHPVRNGNWVAGGGRNGTGTAKINTGRLDSGVYCAEIDAQATGYNSRHMRLYFAMLDENDVDYSSENLYFTISATEVTTETNTHIIAFLRGANAVRIYYSKDGDNLEEFDFQDGPGLDIWFSRADSGAFKLYLSGEYNGVWSEPTEVCTLTITADHEFDSEPAVTVNGSSQGNAVPVDESNPNRLNISIGRDENAEGYHVQIMRYEDGRQFFDWFVDLNRPEDAAPFTIGQDCITVSIDDDCIEPGCMYQIDCYAHASNYNCRGSRRLFVLQPAGGQNMTLEISPRDDDGYWTGRDVNVMASAPGATAIHIRMNGEDRWYRGDTVNANWGIWDTQNLFCAYATTDPIPQGEDFDWRELDVNWSMQSEPVWIGAKTLGDTLVPSLTFNDHVAKGEWFEFTIGDDGDARQMDIRILDDDGREFEFRRFWAPGTYKISTANLNPGQRYWVSMNCVQDQHMWAGSPRKELHVDEPLNNTAFFRTDKTTLYPGEPFIPTVYAPGAEHIWIENTNDGGLWGDWNGDNATNGADWEWWYDDPGQYSLTAWASYPGSAERAKIGDVVFTVLEPARLDEPVITVPNEADVTKDINIRVTPVPNGYFYFLQLHYNGQNGEDWLSWDKTINDVDQNCLTVTIPARTLEPNKPYWVDVYVNPADRDYAHNGSDAHVSIMTVDGENRDERITVEVNPDDNVTMTAEGIFIPINVDFSVTVRASGSPLPTAIAVYMGDRTEYRFFNDGDGSADTEVVRMNEYQPCPETIFVRAYYGDMSGYNRWEDVPWGDLNWGSASSTVVVNFTSNGHAGQADVFNHWATIAGRDMVVTVTLGNNANEAHANFDRTLGGWDEDLVFDNWIGWDPTEGTENQGTITIPTEGVDIGTYRLYVDNSGVGYENSRTTAWFLIVEDPYKSTSKLTLPTGLKVIDDGAFEGIAADTVIIPDGVTTIGSGAFRNSKVRLVVIPASVTSIAGDAFEGTNLEIVYGFDDGPALQLVHDTAADAFCYIGD